MAYVVRRRSGSWEIRESVATERGPRSRTLAGFRRYTPAVVRRAVSKASRPTSAAEVYDALVQAGAVSAAADDAARALLAEVAAGRPPSPGLRRLVLAALAEPADHSVPGEGAAEWFTATEAARGYAVRDLMHFTDNVPLPPPRPLAYP